VFKDHLCHDISMHMMHIWINGLDKLDVVENLFFLVSIWIFLDGLSLGYNEVAFQNFWFYDEVSIVICLC
jgi:hypothetical protein